MKILDLKCSCGSDDLYIIKVERTAGLHEIDICCNICCAYVHTATPQENLEIKRIMRLDKDNSNKDTTIGFYGDPPEHPPNLSFNLGYDNGEDQPRVGSSSDTKIRGYGASPESQGLNTLIEILQDIRDNTRELIRIHKNEQNNKSGRNA